MKRLINNSHASDSWFLPFNGQASAEPMTSALRQKSAFSLLEKPLRSDLSPAKLTQSQAQSSHTEFRKAHSSGFSLAEAMVMLVVISILLAVSAPLIAKKSNADRNRLIVPGVSPHIATAMGANQNLGVGVNNPTAKLHVTANRMLGNFVSTLTGNNAAAHNTEIFRVSPNNDTPVPAAANNFVPNPNGFKIYADGTTNIRACVPNYGAAIPAVSPAINDGYVVSSRCVIVGAVTHCPAMRLTGMTCNAPAAGGNCNLSQSEHTFQGVVVVPVAQGDGVVQVALDAAPNSTVDNVNIFNFVPCVQPR